MLKCSSPLVLKCSDSCDCLILFVNVCEDAESYLIRPKARLILANVWCRLLRFRDGGEVDMRQMHVGVHVHVRRKSCKKECYDQL